MKTELVEEEIQAAVERRLGLTHVSWIQADRESTRVTLRSLINGLYEAAAATHIVVLKDALPFTNVIRAVHCRPSRRYRRACRR